MIIDKLPKIERISTQEQIVSLQTAAHADNHLVHYPTHIVTKEGTVIGFASVCSIPYVDVWLDSKLTKPQDSVIALTVIENTVREKGFKQAFITAGDKSHFSPVLEKHFGYVPIYQTKVWVKIL